MNRRYQRTASTITSGGNRNPANADFGGSHEPGRVGDFTAQVCLDLANAQRNGAFPSPALFNQIGQRFRRAVASYAEANDIPWVRFGKGDDKLAVMRPHLARQAALLRCQIDGRGDAQVWAGIRSLGRVR